MSLRAEVAFLETHLNSFPKELRIFFKLWQPHLCSYIINYRKLMQSTKHWELLTNSSQDNKEMTKVRSTKRKVYNSVLRHLDPRGTNPELCLLKPVSTCISISVAHSRHLSIIPLSCHFYLLYGFHIKSLPCVHCHCPRSPGTLSSTPIGLLTSSHTSLRPLLHRVLPTKIWPHLTPPTPLCKPLNGQQDKTGAPSVGTQGPSLAQWPLDDGLCVYSLFPSLWCMSRKGWMVTTYNTAWYIVGSSRNSH